MLVAWMLSSALAGGACAPAERSRPLCPVKGGKVVSVCEGPRGLTYRFGPPGAPELEVSPATELSHRALGEDHEQHVVSFWNAGHRYAVVVERTEDQLEAGVVVRKGADKLAALACREPLSADFTETAGRFAGDPASVEAWVGAWDRGGDGSFVIVARDGGLVVTDGLALFPMGPGSVHTGEVHGPLVRTGAKGTVTLEDCTLTLERVGPDHLVAADNGRCGGLNVRFDGDYHRLP